MQNCIMLNSTGCKEDVSCGEVVRVVINVGGVRNEVYRSTLETIPDTRLAKLVSGNRCDAEFFFDRNPAAFAHILNYYRTGKLCCAGDVCAASFGEELAYWGISESGVELCCCTTLKRYQNAQEAVVLSEQKGHAPAYVQGTMEKVWAVFDAPHSSSAAMILAVISTLFILVAVTAQSVESVYQEVLFAPINITVGNITVEEEMLIQTAPTRFWDIEAICVFWFTLEFLVRLVCCPSKLRFFRSPLNLVDLVAILPFYMNLRLYEHGRRQVTAMRTPLTAFVSSLRAARVIRLLRVYKMMPCDAGLSIRALGLALRASMREFCLLGIALFVALGFHATLIFYVDHRSLDETNFKNIPFSFWFAVVTMTGVGYGDMYPESWPPMVVAMLCALTGLLVVVMPIPILLYNFTKYYALLDAKQTQTVKGGM